MAQAQPEELRQEPQEKQILTDSVRTSTTSSSSSSSVPFKFNAQAPEFVPRSHTQYPVSSYFYPCYDYLGSPVGSADWYFLGDQESASYLISSPPGISIPNTSSKNVLTDDLRQKIVKQAEYQFSDMSLLANESLLKQISKDPDGYVPISFVASTKKIKSIVTHNQLLVQALRSSTKLVVSDDGKKVRRKHPFTEKDRDEMQSRTVLVENLPEDHSHQNLERIFSFIGSVKTIRVCHPQEPNSSRSKGDFSISNKLHALVEYDSQEIAEKAADQLNDERNWRKGLRVRLLLRCLPKSVLKSRRSEIDGILDDDDGSIHELHEDFSQLCSTEPSESNMDENAAAKKGWCKGRCTGQGHIQNHGGRGLLAATLQLGSGFFQVEPSPKHASKGPRMPNGTRGFTMGRGKRLNTLSE